jgi:integrase/recombinase XerD
MVATLTRPRTSDLTSRQERAEALAWAFLAGHTGHTLAAYRVHLRDWWAFLAQAEVNVLDAQRVHVEAFARSLEAAGKSRATIAHKLSTVACFYRYAIEEGDLDRSPTAFVRRPRLERDSTTLGLDRDEARRFLAAAEAASPRDHVLACLLVENALRVSEACSASITDLSNERGHRVLTITGKGSRRALIALAPTTARAIDAYLDERADNEPALILSNAGGRIDRYSAARIVRRLCRAAGISKRISPHSLRHTGITAALDAGVPFRDVQAFARHSSPQSTQRYDRARENLDRSAVYRVSAYLSSDD